MILYRYYETFQVSRDSIFDEGGERVVLHCDQHAPTKATRQGHWIEHGTRFVLNLSAGELAHCAERPHAIPPRRWAYPTKALALAAYLRRKQRQIQHTERTLRRATEGLDLGRKEFAAMRAVKS